MLGSYSSSGCLTCHNSFTIHGTRRALEINSPFLHYTIHRISTRVGGISIYPPSPHPCRFLDDARRHKVETFHDMQLRVFFPSDPHPAPCLIRWTKCQRKYLETMRQSVKKKKLVHNLPACCHASHIISTVNRGLRGKKHFHSSHQISSYFNTMLQLRYLPVSLAFCTPFFSFKPRSWECLFSRASPYLPTLHHHLQCATGDT